MTSIAFIEPDGSRLEVEANDGWSVMQIAVNEGVRGVVAECGGALACATCHCYVEAGADALPPKHPDEEEMLAGVAAPRAANSRLSCQLTVSPSLGGLVIRFPDRQ